MFFITEELTHLDFFQYYAHMMYTLLINIFNTTLLLVLRVLHTLISLSSN